MDQTPNLNLPYLAAAQSQKHVTHNEAIRALDALVQIAVNDRDLASPPPSPADGARYIVAPPGTGAWSGQAGQPAAWQDGAWAYFTPLEGWIAWVRDEDLALVFDGADWVTLSSPSAPATLPLLGINAAADTTNRLTLASPASLFNHDGAGHQLKVNKASPADTASLLLQDAFSGRAELGLPGDDHFRLKVSADGAAWHDALLVNSTTGLVSFPSGQAAAVGGGLLVNGDLQLNQRAFGGGAIPAGTYAWDRWKAGTAGAIATLAGQSLTVTSGQLRQIVSPVEWGISSLASTTLTLSVENLTGGNLIVAVGSASGIIAPGAGRRRITLATAPSDNGNLVVGLSPDSAAVTFARVKLEIASHASAWYPRPRSTELALAQRYFWRSGCNGNTQPRISVGLVYNGGQCEGVLQFPVTMRSPPTVRFSSPAHFKWVLPNTVQLVPQAFPTTPYQIAFEPTVDRVTLLLVGASASGQQTAEFAYNNSAAYIDCDAEL